MKKINEYEYEIEKEGAMLVSGRIFANESILNAIKKDNTINQIKNVAKLPGIIRASYAMPDAHNGYGFPIGGVAAFDIKKGVVCPGGVGYDINCSVRLLRTNLTINDIKGKEKQILKILKENVAHGLGEKGNIRITREELDKILTNGSQEIVKKGYGIKEDYLHTEEKGKLPEADPRNVSQRAKARGLHQLGSLGAGNHFLDLLVVDETFDENTSKTFGLKKNQIVILIHCGSRGLGHQVASDYIKLMDQEYGHPDFDRELVNVPIMSNLGKKYLSAMAAAANFAFANKQIITHQIRTSLKKIFPDLKASVVYDICHNIAKFETHKIDEEEKEVLVMRKGATRSFGPNNPNIPKDYQDVGQPVLIPGTMGTASYVLAGTKKAEEISFGSTAHGAGRVKSRTEARKNITFEQAKKEMEKRGILVESKSKKGLIEESPSSYKNIDEVIEVSTKAGLGKLVAKLRPLIVLIG